MEAVFFHIKGQKRNKQSIRDVGCSIGFRMKIMKERNIQRPTKITLVLL